MNDILSLICDHARLRVAESKGKISSAEIARLARSAPSCEGGRFVAALKRGRAIIAEVKRASPSKGVIAEHFHPVEQACLYERAGADCVSVLTEPKWFQGSDEIFLRIRKKAAGLPLLRKDFVVDEYQLYEARLLGANAVLLIVAVLGEKVAEYLALAKELGLAALVETHDAGEIALAARAGAQIIGVNNRNLKNFDVDLGNSLRLAEDIPNGTLFVAESGVRTPEDADRLFAGGAHAVLVGEALMRAADPAAMIGRIKGGV